MTETKRKSWTGQEAYDALHLEPKEFLERYPERNIDSLRLYKKRVYDGNSEPTDGYIGLRMGYFDIETSGFKADFDSILCAGVADGFGNVTQWRRDDYEQAHVLDDRQMCIDIRDHLEENYDIIVTWYGKIFDVPFLNTRLTLEHQEMPYQARMHIDAFYLIPQGVAGRSLDNIARALHVQDEEVHKTKFDKRTWALANAGSREAMDEIVDHNWHDVLLTRRVFEKLRPSVKNIHR